MYTVVGVMLIIICVAVILGPIDIFGSGERVRVRGYRDWPFGATARFRLLLKGSLMEFYLDDLLIQVHTLPQEATGHIGLLHGGEPSAITGLKAWQAAELSATTF